MARISLTRSRTYPAGVARSYDAVLPYPLPQLMHRRFAAIPAIVEVRDQDGTWGAGVGQSRTIVLSDRGTIRETLTELDRPRTFAYALTDITGPMKALAKGVEGRWEFPPAGTGVRVTWSWQLEPANALATRLMPAFARMWQGFARQALEEIETLLVPRG